MSFRRAVAEKPIWTAANIGLAAALLHNGRSEEACQVLEPSRNLASLPSGYWIWLTGARLQSQLRIRVSDRRWEIVEQALSQAEKLEPTNVELPLARAEFLFEKGDIDGAGSTLEKAQANFPQEVGVWVARADFAGRLDRYAEAESILDQALNAKAFGDHIEVRLAQCRLWSQRASALDRAKMQALSGAEDPGFSVGDRARHWNALAAAWYRLSDWDKAEERWRKVAKILPRDQRSRSWRLDLALQKGQTASARHWLDALRRAEGETGVFWRYGACAILVHEARRRRANLDEARRHLHEINRIHKNWPLAAALAAAIAEMEGNYQLAIREYGRALDHSEPQPGVLTQLLEILIQRREFGKADSEVTKYEQKQPLTPDLARLGAEAAMGLRDKQSAKVALRRAESGVTMPIRDYRDALWLSAICQAAGESARAEELLTSALNVAGHAPDVWIAWMEFLARSNQRKRVSQEIDRMEKTLHKNRVPLTHARCYDALQQLDQAASAYLTAVAGAGDDPTVLSFTADFFRRADLNDDARGFHERLLDPALAARRK